MKPGPPLLEVALAALSEYAPDALVRGALARPRGVLAGDGPVVVVAVGKAATPMGEAALGALGGRVRRALVVHPEGAPGPRARRGLSVCDAPHPVPDARSVAAADRALRLVAGAGCPVLVLLSGGASSLLASPSPGLSFQQKRTVVASLLSSGAPIADINLVRRHLSRVKGGGLLRAAYPSPVHTLILSDVIAGRRSDVGSGPSLPSRAGLQAARRAVARWLGAWPGGIPLSPCVGPRDREAAGATSELLLSPELFARRVARRLEARLGPGTSVTVGDAFTSDIHEVAPELVAASRALAAGEARVFASECTLRLPQLASERGRGGRASHLAALVGPRLPSGVSLLCLATDGVDGASGHAGALVRREDFTAASRLREALRGYHTGALHDALGTSVVVPRGHNLADLVVLARDA
jgi:glycerate 2-kinase